MALLGILLHAVALVRHASLAVGQGAHSGSVAAMMPMMQDIARDDLREFKADSVICHADPGSREPQHGGQSRAPDKSSSCPICMGLCAAVALAIPDIQLANTVPLHLSQYDAPADQRVETHLRIRPASRGPPSLA